MSVILHIETTTLNCAVALFRNEEVIASKSIREQGYSHAENIMPFIDSIIVESGLSKKDINAVSVSGGPGSYTGLRIGVATAKGICHALSIPLISIDTLTVLKKQSESICPGKDAYVSMLDARRMEVYSRTFTDTYVTEVEAVVIDHESQDKYNGLGSICFIGDGAGKCKNVLSGEGREFIEAYPSAEAAVELACDAFEKNNFVDLASYEPFYLKAFKAGRAKDPFNLRDKTSRFAQ
ncbi:MAG: tRNA (adenosine(37)-N6)-threonylcarbamoyltransferase complex dimerization subunit type 1 TsaB [Crocinitomicaceae bacterium]|nr:tRNA (adenosine(37)-N6)-threonylcarbamoyltransferase complex dimerization subunit type 1 TsaB [Crocinitomicaceae bacterium]